MPNLLPDIHGNIVCTAQRLLIELVIELGAPPLIFLLVHFLSSKASPAPDSSTSRYRLDQLTTKMAGDITSCFAKSQVVV